MSRVLVRVIGVVVTGVVLGTVVAWQYQAQGPADDVVTEGIVFDLTHEGIQCPAIGEP